MSDTRAPVTAGFVDVHSHVLYGMDDGARTLEDSIEMLNLAAATGTTDIVATPHANSHYAYDLVRIDDQIAELNATVEGIRVHRGCDFHLQMDNIEDAVAYPWKYSVNGRGYLMVEFPDTAVIAGADTILGYLLDAGLTPIITHPERTTALRKQVDELARWVDFGCYLQVTAGSITGRFGKSARTASEVLLERGLVHMVASDAHDCSYRPPVLRPAYEMLSELYGESEISALFIDNPRAVIEGAPLAAPVTFLQRRRHWYEFWRRDATSPFPRIHDTK